MRQKAPEGDARDRRDERIAKWGRSRHEGYRKFKHSFQQPPPMLFTQDHHPLWLADTYRARSAFLIGGGPSFRDVDKAALLEPGVITMGVNNSVRTFRPNMHCSVDGPDHWVRSLWLDPRIQKFCPIDHAAKKIFNSDAWEFMGQRVGDCPNVVFYKRNEHFQAKQFLWEDTFNWGNHKNYGGCRSVLLPALRILFHLGFRKVFLLGVDLNMTEGSTYHFEQARSKGSVKGNNETYAKLKEWLAELRPLFEKEDFYVYNCNPSSNLKAFDFVPFADAMDDVRAHMDFVDVSSERTAGLYETKAEDKEKGINRVMEAAE